MCHSKPEGSPGKSHNLLERQETIVSGCRRRGVSCFMCPQMAEHCRSELQRLAQAMAFISDPRGGHRLLLLPLLSPRVLCASAGHYPHPPRSLCSMPLPGSPDPGTTSLGEHTACLRLLQLHAGLCCCRLTLHSNYDYHTPPSPWPE